MFVTVLGGGEAEIVTSSVERDAELTRVAPDLGDEKAALYACHRRGRKLGRIGVFAQLATSLHTREAVAHVGFPAVQTRGDSRTGVWVDLGELADEAANRAAA